MTVAKGSGAIHFDFIRICHAEGSLGIQFAHESSDNPLDLMTSPARPASSSGAEDQPSRQEGIDQGTGCGKAPVAVLSYERVGKKRGCQPLLHQYADCFR